MEDSVSSSSYHYPMFLTYAALQGVCVNLRVSVCVCVCVRERERERVYERASVCVRVSV